jgi:cyclic lactone autoinducer peptide
MGSKQEDKGEDDYYGVPWNALQNPSVVFILLMFVVALSVKCYGTCTFYFDQPEVIDTNDSAQAGVAP